MALIWENFLATIFPTEVAYTTNGEQLEKVFTFKNSPSSPTGGGEADRAVLAQQGGAEDVCAFPPDLGWTKFLFRDFYRGGSCFGEITKFT